MENKYNKAIDILNKYNQNHVIKFLKSPDGNINYNLVEQVLNIDFNELNELYKKTFEDLYVDLEELQPITGVNLSKLNIEEVKKYKKIGTDIIKNNKFAIATMAGRTRN